LRRVTFRREIRCPLGVHINKETELILFSRHATRVRLELYRNANDSSPTRIIDLDPTRHRTGDLWHVWLRGIPAGQLYGYRIEGPRSPLRFTRSAKVSRWAEFQRFSTTSIPGSRSRRSD